MTVVSIKSPRKPKGSGHLRRSEILEAAERIFAELGYSGATVRKIAEQVGVSSTAIYLHFPDKRAMLTEIATAAMEPLLAEATRISTDASVDAVERARRMVQAYMRFAVEHPSSYEIVFTDAPRELIGAQDPARELFSAYYRNFKGVISELEAQGRLRAANAQVAAQVLWAGCHGVISLMAANPNVRWAAYEDLRDTMIDALLRGLVSDQG